MSRSWNFIRNLSFLEISLVSLGVSIALNLFFLFFKKTPKETNQDSVRDRLNNAYDKAKWNLVIKIAQTMSRPLWLLGLYDMRVDYLKKGIKAAESNEEETNKEQAKFHLDIGWTKFTIYQKTKEGDVDKAIQDIKEGIETAEENISEEKQHKKDRYYQLIVEGYRHLVGIYIHKRNMSEIKKNMVLAVENWNKITEDNSWKGKVKMGIDEAKGHVEIAKGNIKKAIVIFERVQKQYEKVGDRDRAVKMYNYIGNACLENEQNHKAKKNFLEGHQKSLSWGRAESQYSFMQ